MPGPECALIVDDGENSLGQLALRILRLGVDVFYAKAGDEAWLLADQEAGRIRLLMFPPGIDLELVARLRDRLRDPRSAPRTLVVVGERPDESRRKDLRECGVEWALWEPYDESALRQLLATALTASQGTELRKQPRLPTMLLARAFSGVHRKDVIVSTLSISGAFLETPHPFLEGTRITLDVALPEGQIVVKAEVVYAKSQRGPDPLNQPAGMGVAFRELDPRATQQLGGFLDALQEQFGV